MSDVPTRSSRTELIDRLVWRVLGRAPRTEEISRLVAFLDAQAETYGRQRSEGTSADSDFRRALADLCLVLFNSPEFLYVE